MVEFNASNTVWYSSEIDSLIRLMLNLDNEIVNVSLSNAIWPPEFGLENFNINIYVLFLDCLERFSNNFITELDQNMIILLNDFRNIQGYSKVDYSFLFTDESVSGPYIVDLNIFKRFNVNLLPNAESHQVRSPVPTVLVAGFSCMSVIERHWVCALPFSVLLLGRLNFDLQLVFSSSQVLIDDNRVFSESVFSG